MFNEWVMEHCPSCARPFRSFLDYPAVYVHEFSRFPVPDSFPYFLDLRMGRKVPQDVIDAFAENGKLRNKLSRIFRKRSEPIKGIRHLGDFLEREGDVWVKSSSGYGCFRMDEKKSIFEGLEPYLKSLENAVGSTVFSNMLAPNLARQDDLLFGIPGSGYSLALGTRALYDLGWGEDLLGEDKFSLLLDKVRNGGKGLYEVIRQEFEERIAAENHGLPQGFERMSLYVIGLKPFDTSAVLGWDSGQRVVVKFAEFVYCGRTLLVRR